MLVIPSKKTLAVISVIALAAICILWAGLSGSAPVITLNGDTVVKLKYGESYVEPGATAYSPGLGTELEVTISGNVSQYIPGTAEIVYEAESLGRMSRVVRRVVVAPPEYEPVPVVSPAPTPIPEPVPTPLPTPTPMPDLSRFELIGDRITELPCGRFFEDPGFIALDKNGEDISSLARVEGSVTPWLCGDQYITYSLPHEKGGVTTLVRTVRVVPVEPEATVPTEKVIYLTFDDGPDKYTRNVLDLLDRYEIKATFFVVTSHQDLSLLKEIKARGHSIGLHCHMHDYSDNLYSSSEAYIKDFLRAQQRIYETVGEYAAISRFPGGSTTAKAYLNGHEQGGFDKVLNILADMGIRWYDWNVQTEGADFIASNYLGNFSYAVPMYETPISLQHDTNPGSYLVLDKLIEWGLAHGYTFAAIDGSTPEVHTN